MAAGREGAEPTAPAPGHQQPLCPSSQLLPVKAGGLQPGQGPQGSLFLCLGHSPLCGRLGPCHTLLRAATHDPGVAQGLEQHQWLLGAALWGELTHTPLEVKPGGYHGPWHPPSGPSCQPGSMSPWLHLLAIWPPCPSNLSPALPAPAQSSADPRAACLSFPCTEPQPCHHCHRRRNNPSSAVNNLPHTGRALASRARRIHHSHSFSSALTL